MLQLETCTFACVIDPAACDAGRQNYLAFRAQLVEKYGTLTCGVGDQCAVYYEQNTCASSCGLPVTMSALSDLASNLEGYAQMACNPACPPLPTPPCDPNLPVCSNGHCQ
jgi:hypothetical protein